MFYCFQNEIQLPSTQSFSIFGSGRVWYLKKVQDGSGTGIPSDPGLDPHLDLAATLSTYFIRAGGDWTQILPLLACFSVATLLPTQQDQSIMAGGGLFGSRHFWEVGRGLSRYFLMSSSIHRAQTQNPIKTRESILLQRWNLSMPSLPAAV